MAEISIIVPVYNNCKYLIRCINSIKEQSHTDWELLLVDDGSTDLSGEICDRYAESDSRIKSFHKKNGGLPNARNYGMTRANGKWITFVDSDDFLYKNAIQTLISNADDYDIIIGGVDFIKSKKKFYPQNSGRISKEDLDNEIFMPYFCTAWTKILKKDFVSSIRYRENVKLIEDTFFILECIKRTDKIKLINQPTYLYNDDAPASKYSMSCEEYSTYMNEFKSLIHDCESIHGIQLSKTLQFINNYLSARVLYNIVKIKSFADYKKEIDCLRNQKLSLNSKKKKIFVNLILWTPKFVSYSVNRFIGIIIGK